jgi:putative Mg2+ transporter-C (MgtC) family protein
VNQPILDVDPAQWVVVARVAVAMIAGGALGLERQLAHKPAGLRTHMLVSGAAALFLGMAEPLMRLAAPLGLRTGLDPLRVEQAIVAGVGFLGAGTIMRREKRGDVEGLTTAASLLLAAAIGTCAALGQVIAAGGTVVLVLITLRLIGWIERGREQREDSRRRTS